jgi:hypothetical protein
MISTDRANVVDGDPERALLGTPPWHCVAERVARIGHLNVARSFQRSIRRYSAAHRHAVRSRSWPSESMEWKAVAG